MRNIVRIAILLSLYLGIVLAVVGVDAQLGLVVGGVLGFAVVLGIWLTRILDRHLATVLKNRDPEHLNRVLSELPQSERRRVEREIDRQVGLCENCGYDLRSSRERCPECGWTIPKDFRRRTS